jgi:hypothetical protein
MSRKKFTKTATFLFPLLNIPKNLFDCSIKDPWGRLKYTNRFINAYCSDTTISKYVSDEENKYVFLVLENYQDVDFETFYSTITAFPNYVDDYDKNDCLVVIFTVPQENLADFNLIYNGKYSEVSGEAKKAILGNNFYTGKPFTLPLILNKSSVLKESWEERLSNPNSEVDLKNQEVWPILDLKKEELNDKVMDTLLKKKILQPQGEF